MLPIARKSVEPLVAHLEPERVSARHQSLHHFVSKSEWSDAALLERVRRWVLPHMNPGNGLLRFIDDTPNAPSDTWLIRLPVCAGVSRLASPNVFDDVRSALHSKFDHTVKR